MFWDNPQMITSHIRHSCVTSDYTGMCEMVIVQDEEDAFITKQHKRLGKLNNEEGSSYSNFAQSFDISVSPGLYGRTPKIESTDKATKSQKPYQTKTIVWKDNTESLTEKDKEEMFADKTVPNHIVNTHSMLSQLVKDSQNVNANPFLMYAKFDGEGIGRSFETKSINFFILFLPTESQRLEPIPIEFIVTATVQDVIGLILYKLLKEGRCLHLQTDVKQYAMHIAEEDGEVEFEFHALDETNLMSHFDFHYLALVEKNKSTVKMLENKNSIEIEIYEPAGGHSIIKVENADVKMKSVFGKLIKKRAIKKSGKGYHLEKQDEEGVAVDLEATLGSMGTKRFLFVKDNQIRESKSEEIEKKESTSIAQDEIMSLQYRSYQVLLIQRLLVTTEVSLGIHSQNIEIDPVSQVKSQKFWTKIKPISLPVDIIADCEMVDEKPGRRAVFRIYYKKADYFKHYEFESSVEVANEIERKIRNILKSRPQAVRNEFLISKERKQRSIDKVKKK